MSVEPGWYKDPAEPTTQRYWDGDGWIGDPLPVDATPPPGPPAVAEPAPPDVPAPAPVPGAPLPVPTPGLPVPPGAPPFGGPPVPPVSGAPTGWPGPGQVPPGTPYPGPVPPGWRPRAPYAYRVFAPPPRPHGMKLAPLGRRLAARMIDFGLLLLLNVVANGFLVWRYVQEIAPLYREILRRSLAGDSSTEGLPQVGEQAGGLQLAILAVAVAVWFAYEVPTTANGGQSPGKRLMGLKVVALADDPAMGFGRSARRWSTMGFPVFLWFCCLGFLIQFVDFVFPLFDQPLRQALHDKRAQTVVVQVPRGPRAPAPTDDRVDTSGGS